MKRATGITCDDILTQEISIHALVKRATVSDEKLNPASTISIHALVKRATGISIHYNHNQKFQSTPS